MAQQDPKEDLREYLPSRKLADRVARGEIWKTPSPASSLEEPEKREGDHPAVAVPRPNTRNPGANRPRRSLWISAVAGVCVLLPVTVLWVLLDRRDGNERGAATASATVVPSAAQTVAPPSTSTSVAPAGTTASSVEAASTAGARSPPSAAPTASATAAPSAPPKGASPRPERSSAAPGSPPATSPASSGQPTSAPAPTKPPSFDPLMNE